MPLRIALPPEAQAFSTVSMGLEARPGTEARSPERSPCWWSAAEQTAAMEAESRSAAVMPSWEQTPAVAAASICSWVRWPSLPNSDWW